MWFLYNIEKVYKFCQISEIKYLSLNTDRYIPKSEDYSTAQSCYPQIMSGSVVLPGARLCPSDNVHMQGDFSIKICVMRA